MLPKKLVQFDYLKKLDDLNFNIVYHDEKAKGQPCFAMDYGIEDFECYKVIDYWDFNIVVSDFEVNSLIDNYDVINYLEYLSIENEYFKKELTDLLNSNNSQIEVLNILIEIVEYLEFLKSCYYVLNIHDEDPLWASINNKDVDYHKNVKIIPSDKKKHIKNDIFINYVISKFISDHKIAVERVINQVKNLISVIEKDYDTKQMTKIKKNSDVTWTKSDTDLLELIIALYESGSIQNQLKDLSQKGAIEALTDFFGIEVKDQYKKLNAARFRKKDDPNIITKLQNSLEEYYQRQNKKL